MYGYVFITGLVLESLARAADESAPPVTVNRDVLPVLRQQD